MLLTLQDSGGLITAPRKIGKFEDSKFEYLIVLAVGLIRRISVNYKGAKPQKHAKEYAIFVSNEKAHNHKFY